MNPSRFAIGLVGLALAGLWYFAGGTEPPAALGADTPRVTAPLAHENLTVYFVYGTDTVPDSKVLSLNEALERDLAVVHETSTVNTLAIENRSPDHELFVQSGDIVKGGKQDRMAATDMLLPPMSGVVAMRAHCVEQGRWTGRGTEDAGRFTSSTKCAAGKELKYANATFQQSAVWANVKQNQDKVSANLGAAVNAPASPTSYQLTLEAPAVQAKVAEYEAALMAAGADRPGVVGVVFVVNGQVTGAEVYGSSVLFQKAWPKLLSAAAVEAVAERTDRPTAVPPTPREVEYYLACGADTEPAGNEPAARESNDQVQTLARRGAYEETAQTYGRARPTGSSRALYAASVSSATDGTPQILSGSNAYTERVTTSALPALAVPPARPTLANTEELVDFAPALPQSTMIVTTPSPGATNRAAVQPAAANVATNQLNSTRTENDSTLMVESRDPRRQNAVIHRSYIKK